jgi:hypothetical protein
MNCQATEFKEDQISSRKVKKENLKRKIQRRKRRKEERKKGRKQNTKKNNISEASAQ